MRFSLPSSISTAGLSIAYVDFICLIISPFFALWLRGDSLLAISESSVILSPVYEYVILTVICGLPVFVFFRINDSVTHLCTSKDIFTVFSAVFVSVLLSSYVVFSISRLDKIPRSVPVLYGFVLFLGLVAYRVGLRGLYEKRNYTEEFIENFQDVICIKKVVIVGLNRFAISAIRLTDAQRPRTTQIISAISPDGQYSGKTISGVKIIGKIPDYGKTFDEYDIHGVKIDELWVADDEQDYPLEFMTLLSRSCKDREIKLISLNDALNLKPIYARRKRDDSLDKLRVFNVIKNDYLPIKRCLDLICSMILCVLLFPVLVLVSAITLYEIGSPILFWQERVGLRGRKFLLYKVRTLGLPFDAHGNILNDRDRLSKLGLMIRRLRLDEIPQFLSILVGDMSGIGPRPLLPRDQPNETRERLLLRPGLTGWAQVNGGELLNIEEKNALDCWYINHVSFKLDLQIVLKTFEVLIYGARRNDIEIQKALDWYKERLIVARS